MRSSIVVLVIVIAFATIYAADASSAAKTSVWTSTVSLPTDGVANNPLRGYSLWDKWGVVPLTNPKRDRYIRVEWADIEKGEGEYDFSIFDRALARLQKGERLGFAVMSANSTSKSGVSVPEYIVKRLTKGFFAPRHAGNPATFYVPDWNDPLYLSGVEKLFAALGAKYDGDPRIAFVDIRMYGNYGEWHDFGDRGRIPYDDPSVNTQGCRAGSAETKRRIVDAQVRAFPHTRLVMMTDDTPSLLYALSLKTRIPIGMRRDSYGWTHFVKDLLPRDISAADRQLILDRWKVAPFIVEPAPAVNGKRFEAGLDALTGQVREFHVSLISDTNFASSRWGDFAADEQQAMIAAGNSAGYSLEPLRFEYPVEIGKGKQLTVRSTWSNLGSAPTYERWALSYSLADSSGNVIWSAPSSLTVGSLLPDSPASEHVDNFPLPISIKPGSYTLGFAIIDPSGYRDPMILPVSARMASSGYALGTVTVGGK
ncbi:MAG: hypothetical protein P4L33_12150 [Capsulimonadaceae bacterium]|nr:hypothetical protein [Capsulimonadaceae bacterium]